MDHLESHPIGPARQAYYKSMRSRMESVGFQFEREQTPHLQNRPEKELKFVHPTLIEFFGKTGRRVRGKKFYLKPLTEVSNSEIGLVNGKLTCLLDENIFPSPNASDAHDGVPAWVNRPLDPALDRLLVAIFDAVKGELSSADDSRIFELIEEYPGLEQPPTKKESRTQSFERCNIVKQHVLRLARGTCELCGEIAPFLKPNGDGFLEVHHVLPLEKGGLDHISNMVGICPNCHRRCHHSEDREHATGILYQRVSRLRKQASRVSSHDQR